MARKGTKDEASRKALYYSRFYGGKIGTAPKVPVRSLADFSIWYTPGVGAVSTNIQAHPDLSFEYTNRWNTIAIATDGSRVLGLGNIGPVAALPVKRAWSEVSRSAYNPTARGSITVIEGTNAITRRQTNRIPSSGRRGRTVSSTCTLPMAQEP